MSEEKKTNKAEEVRAEESGTKLTDGELEQVSGGVFEYAVDLPELNVPINYDGMSFSIRLPKYPNE